MARDRQRAKQRQQARRAARLAERGGQPPGSPPPEAVDGQETERPQATTDGETAHEAIELADLEVGAPPQDVGFSERVIDHPPHAPDISEEEFDEELAEEAGAVSPVRERQARRREEAAGRNRVIAFLENVWSELKRVQWPDRRTLTQLTGVVLFFVIITGAYLGLLDAVFSKIIQKII